MSSEPHWTESGAYPISEGVHRIPLPLPMDGLRAVNVYVIETDDGLTCVDGGWALEVSRRQFEESLRSIGHHPRDIMSFLVTHAHRDHYTQASALRTEFGRASIALGAGDKSTLDHIHSDLNQQPFVERLRAAGAFETAQGWAERADDSAPDRDVWQYPDTWLDSDRTLIVGNRALEAVSTPGHTAGHFVFADTEAGLLFAGDHVLPTITPSVGFEVTAGTQPLRDFLASLAKVRAMPDLQLLPAHGATNLRSHTRIDELLAHHDHRLALCLAAVGSGHQTAYGVARELPWTRHNRHFTELDDFNAGLAVMETLVHLDLLWARDQLTRSVDGNTFVYSPVSTRSDPAHPMSSRPSASDSHPV